MLFLKYYSAHPFMKMNNAYFLLFELGKQTLVMASYAEPVKCVLSTFTCEQ